MKSIFYVGAYTEKSSNGITVCRFDDNTGKLEVLQSYEIPNASYLIMSEDRPMLYGVLETEVYGGKHGGAVVAYRVGSDGLLSYVNTVGTGGVGPCHLERSKAGDYIYAANYGEGTVSVISLDKDGVPLSLVNTLIHHGEKPHAHFVREVRGSGLWVCDLGLDRLMVYTKPETDTVASLELQLPKGAGPRHFAMESEFVYILCELSCEIIAYRFIRGGWEWLQNIDAEPNGLRHPDNGCAAIRISPDGKFLIASNRGPDSISVYERDSETGLLTLVHNTKTFGAHPRDFCFDPSGRYILCANRDTDNITLFEFASDGGMSRVNDMVISQPVCICFS